jgi:tyrosyl-tRNA synthetase
MNQTNLNKQIEKILSRGVVEILPSKKGLADLMKRRKIRLYLGIDPTSPDLHLGHLVTLKKLKEFQDLGHEVILLFGTFTAQIGDPSEREIPRKPLSFSQVKKNMKNYKKQFSKILDPKKTKIKYNHQWLGKLKFSDLIKITSYFTISRLLERDMFKKRLKKGREVWLHEILYPLMQGYDSVAMDVDLEIGATDQTFNMLVGRKLQRIFNKKEKFILTSPILLGLDGRKMSKTYNNTVNLEDSPENMYGKIMTLKDELIWDYFKLLTDLSLKEIDKIKKDVLAKVLNPKEAKSLLAFEIVKLCYNKTKAEKAKKEFERVFQERKPPTKIKKIKIKEKAISILELLLKANLANSKSQAKRLILQGGVKINNQIQKDWRAKIVIKKNQILKVGKRRFVKII